MTIQHEEDFLSSAHEEPSTLNEETLEAVTGGGNGGSKPNNSHVAPAPPAPGEWGILTRTNSGTNVYKYEFAANEALNAKVNPANWKKTIETVTGLDGWRRSGYVLRPK
jgi:hypothetical protein